MLFTKFFLLLAVGVCLINSTPLEYDERNDLSMAKDPSMDKDMSGDVDLSKDLDLDLSENVDRFEDESLADDAVHFGDKSLSEDGISSEDDNLEDEETQEPDEEKLGYRRRHRRWRGRCRKVSFLARLCNSRYDVKDHRIIKFDNVPVNNGRGYHQNLGVFFAPVTGTYEISSTLMAYTSRSVWAEIVHNHRVVARIHAYGNQGCTGSETVVINMRRGDHVWVRINRYSTYVRGNYYSTFSGHLIC